MKKYLLLFGALIFLSSLKPCSIYGQESVQFRLIDNEHREPIPFITISNTEGKLILVSDYDGTVKFDKWGELNETGDSLIFTSLFFETVRIASSEIPKLHGKDMVMLIKVLELSAAEVRPLPEPDKIAKEIAESFYRKFDTRDYISEGTLVQTVMANGRYREFMAGKGYYYSTHFTWKQPKPFGDRKFQTGWVLYNMMRSDAFAATTDAILDPPFVYSDNALKMFDITYNSSPNHLPVNASQRITIYYSPLHRSATKHYHYKLDSVYNEHENRIIVLGFRTKNTSFPNKCPLYAEGKIIYDYTSKKVKRIELYNSLNYLDNYRRMEVVLPSIHETFLSISFKGHDGFLYIDETLYERKWNKSAKELNYRFYYSSVPARRNASLVGLVERAWQKTGTPNIVNNMGNSRLGVTINWDYCAYDPDVWNGVETIGGVKISDVKADLGQSRSLEEQAMGNALKTNPDKDYEPRMKSLYEFSKSIKQQNESE